MNKKAMRIKYNPFLSCWRSLAGILLLALAACQMPDPEAGRTTTTPPVSFVTEDKPTITGLPATQTTKAKKRTLNIQVNDDDQDGDGIPDFADGFDAFAEIEEDVAVEADESGLKPIRLDIAQTVVPAQVRLMFDYPESSPDKVRRRRHGSSWEWLAFWQAPKPDEDTWFEYTAPPGFRLWRKDGPKRDKRPVAQGGDFIPAGATLALTDLETDDQQALLYVEAVPGAEDMLGSNLTVLSYTAESGGRDSIALRPILMQFVLRGENGEIVPTDFVGVCTPRPQVKIKDLSPADIRIDPDKMLAAFTIRCDEIIDPVADNLPPGTGEIEEVCVYMDYDKVPIARASVSADRSGPASFWRQYPYRGSFKDIVIQFPIRNNNVERHHFKVRTSNNAAGLTGYDEVEMVVEDERLREGSLRCRWVNNQNGSGAGSYLPFTLRVKGIADSDVSEMAMQFGDTTFGVIKRENGWLYPAIEGHVVIAINSFGLDKPGSSSTIYYPKVQFDALRKLIDQANGFFRQGKVKEAVEIFRQAAEKGDANGQYMLAEMYGAGTGVEKNRDLAVQWLKRAAAQGHADAMNTLAYYICLRDENLEEAKILVEKALARDLKNGHFLHTAGKIHLNLGNDERALTCLEKANALVPDHPEHEEDLGDLYHKLGRHEEADKLWQAAAAHTQNQEQKARIERKRENSFTGTAP